MRIGAINVMPLLGQLDKHPELWEIDRERELYPGSAHHDAHSIMLRGPIAAPGADLARLYFEELEAIDYRAAEILGPAAADVVLEALEHVGPIGELGRVMITKLPPGGKIDLHVDEGLYSEVYDRFHVVLLGDTGNHFACGGEDYIPPMGRLFWFNHKRPHLVRNDGKIDRIHLIIDAIAPEYTAYRGVYYQPEPLLVIRDEMQELLEANWREIARYQDIDLDPDWDAYQAVEAKGELRTFTVRDAGRLVGYVIFFVRPAIHYRRSLQAIQDVIYLHKDFRKGATGVRLLRFAEQRLAGEGVQVVYHHAKLTNDLGRLLELMDYELVDQIYGKRLDKNGGEKGAGNGN